MTSGRVPRVVNGPMLLCAMFEIFLCAFESQMLKASLLNTIEVTQDFTEGNIHSIGHKQTGT